MKNLLLLTVILIVISACNDQPKEAAQQNASVPDSTEMKVQIPESGCYLYASGKDTVALKMEMFPNVVTGVLRYDYFGKDGSTGNLDGKLQGDTLVAFYDFMAEGTRSIRQVVFVIKNDVAMEGYGDMEEKDGKMVFKDLSKADFSKSVPLRKISCQDYDPAQNLSQVKETSAGSEELYSHQWDLAELENQAVTKTGSRSAHLLFSPGKVNSVAGSTGCNRLKGTFDLSGTSAIKFSPLVTTKMACPGIEYETKFLDVLSKVNKWRITNNQLLLSNDDKVLAKFKAVAPENR